MDNYINNLRELLGEEMFSNLSDELFKKASVKFPRAKITDVAERVEFNMATILIVGVEKGRGRNDEDELIRRVIWRKVCSQTVLVEKSVKKTIEAYEKYIDVIVKNIKESKKNESSN